jgi:hypothetical protein
VRRGVRFRHFCPSELSAGAASFSSDRLKFKYDSQNGSVLWNVWRNAWTGSGKPAAVRSHREVPYIETVILARSWWAPLIPHVESVSRKGERGSPSLCCEPCDTDEQPEHHQPIDVNSESAHNRRRTYKRPEASPRARNVEHQSKLHRPEQTRSKDLGLRIVIEDEVLRAAAAE